MASEKCPEHQYLHKSTMDCEDCPDGKEPNEERDACEDETSLGLTEMEWVAVGTGSGVFMIGVSGLAWALRGTCKKILGIDIDEPTVSRKSATPKTSKTEAIDVEISEKEVEEPAAKFQSP
ncbi:flaEY [Symbiodinium necroappetens]|nr:flaEY [Symbiodinium necroappetens]